MFSSSFSVRTVGVLMLGMAVGIALTFMALKPRSDAPSESSPTADSVSPKVLYWYDPMHPTQHFDKPGPSPFMDMDLVAKYAESTSASEVRVDSAMLQNLGIRKTPVVRMPLGAQHELPGTLRFNERNQAIIQLRAAGFVEKAWPLAPGDQVIVGQPIATLYIPEWLDAQNELLAQTATNSPRLLNTLRSRLQLLGMSDALIAHVEKTRKPETRLTIKAPISGILDTLTIKTGMSLASGQTLARINGINTLWLDVAIPEAEAAGLRSGDSAIFYPANTKAEALKGSIDSLLPAVNDATRTVTARVIVPNPNGTLKPGTTGLVVLQSSQADTGLAIPTEALIRTGKRTLVMLADADNHFRPVMVTAGAELGAHTIITAGLDEGQEIVVSGQFLLDSEATLLGIAPEPVATAPAMDHKNHEMGSEQQDIGSKKQDMSAKKPEVPMDKHMHMDMDMDAEVQP